MALRADRYTVSEEIGYFVDTVCEAGGLFTLSTSGSGVALDQAEAVVAYHATGSGQQPVGINTLDVVNKDLTKTHLNFYNNEMQVGGKAHSIKQGWVVTNFVLGTPTVGQPAYVAESGYLRPTRAGTWLAQVGHFMSTKDEDGYAKVWVNIV